MSLQPKTITPVPLQTRQVAQAAFPHGNRYMQLRDTVGTIYNDEDFVDLFPPRGQPAQAPWLSFWILIVAHFAHFLSQMANWPAFSWRIDRASPNDQCPEYCC